MVDPVEPHPNETLYLPFEELMKNLQDKGIDDKSSKGTLVFPKLKKIATKMWKLLDKDPYVNITKNAGRGTNTIFKGLLGQKKIVGKTSIHQKLRGYTLENQSQVYILHKNEETIKELELCLYKEY